MSVWLMMIAAGLLTYGQRLSFLLFWERLRMPRWLQRALRYVPIAVLTAIIVPDLLLPGGEFSVALNNYRLWAALLAVVVAARTRNTLLTIVVGMAALLLLEALAPAG